MKCDAIDKHKWIEVSLLSHSVRKGNPTANPNHPAVVEKERQKRDSIHFSYLRPQTLHAKFPPQALTQTDMFVLVGCKVLHYGERAECKRSDFNSTLSPPNLLPQTSHLQLRKINDTVNALVSPESKSVWCTLYLYKI